jgi:replicative DNA helicase
MTNPQADTYVAHVERETAVALFTGAMVDRDLLQAAAMLPAGAWPPGTQWIRAVCVDAVGGSIELAHVPLQQALRDGRYTATEHAHEDLTHAVSEAAMSRTLAKRTAESALALMRDRWDRYRAHRACRDAVIALVDTAKDSAPVLTTLVDTLRSITERTPERGPATMRDLITGLLEYMEQPPDLARAPSIPELADVIGPYQRGTVTIVGGRPGMGKSAFLAGEIMALLDRGVPCFLQTLEMTQTQTFARILASRYGVDAGGIIKRDPRAVAKATTVLLDEHDRLIKLPLFVDDSPSATAETVVATARILCERHQLGALFVDYLQILAPSDPRIPREQQISHMSQTFRAAAKELDIPVILAAQLNRESAGRKEARPVLSDLRESGAIEQDATTIIFPFRPEYAEGVKGAAGTNVQQKPFERAEIIVAKNRYGGVCSVPCRWEGRSSRFVPSDFGAMVPDGINRHGGSSPPPMPDYE